MGLLEEFQSVGVLRHDPGRDEAVALAWLGRLSGAEILALHEEIEAGVRDDWLRYRPDDTLIDAYCQEQGVAPGDLTEWGALEARLDFDYWRRGLAAHCIVEGWAPAGSENQALQRDAELVAEDGPLFLCVRGNTGTGLLDRVFPLAYERVTGQLWPRFIRHRMSLLWQQGILLMQPVGGMATMKHPVLAFWQGVQAAAEDIKDSEHWWRWWRSGPFRCGELKPVTRGSTEEAIPLNKACTVWVNSDGRSLTVRMRLNRAGTAKFPPAEMKAWGTRSVADLARLLTDTHGFAQQPPLSSPASPEDDS